MDKKHNVISVILIVLSFVVILISLFCIFTSAGADFGIFNGIFLPKTEQTATPTSSLTDTPAPTTAVPGGTETTALPPETAVKTPSVTPEPTNETPWILEETPDAGKFYQNKLTFLGDSTTHGMITYEVLTGGKDTKQVWYGENGNTITFEYVNTINIICPEIDNTAMKISEAAGLAKPQYLIITLGVTGGVSSGLVEEQFKETYTDLVTSILEASPNTKIVLQSIYPVTANLNSEYSEKINNAKIEVANEWVCDVAKTFNLSGKSVWYLDTYSYIIGSDGYLPAEYSNGDGLHLSVKGYQKILTYIRTHKIPD